MGAPSLQINDAIGQQKPSPLRMGERPTRRPSPGLGHVGACPEPMMQTQPVSVDLFSVTPLVSRTMRRSREPVTCLSLDEWRRSSWSFLLRLIVVLGIGEAR